MAEKWDLIVVGGGAAGFFCAVNAASLRPGLKVCILEKTGKLLTKVSVSGGGRCNVTHACFDIDTLSGYYPRGTRFVRKAFHHFSVKDTIRWFKDRGVELKTEADGRMFPATNTSATIVQCLLQEASRQQVHIELNQEITRLTFEDGCWKLQSAKGRMYLAEKICLAQGGLNKLSTQALFGNLKHTLIPPVPSLFTFNMPGHDITKLMGVSVEDVSAKIPGTKLEAKGPLLLTHWGMSGPAILKLSAWGARELAQMQYQFKVMINWLPQYTEVSLREQLTGLRSQMHRQSLLPRNPFSLPQRLWEYLVTQNAHVAPDKRWADLSAKETNALVKSLLFCEFDVKGKTTFKEEFVTAGGVSLSEIDHRTMESKLHPGLFFAGEVMDVDGVTGGFNFQHAWTSGFLAGSKCAITTDP